MRTNRNKVSIHPMGSEAAVAAAFCLAMGLAEEIEENSSQRLDEVVISDGITSQSIQTVSGRPVLFELVRNTGDHTTLVAFGLSYPDGSRATFSHIIAELTNPKLSLETLLPGNFAERVKFLRDLMRGMIVQTIQRLAALDQTCDVEIEQVGNFRVAHLPSGIDTDFRGLLMARGADVVTYSNSKSIGFKLSKEAQEFGLSALDFEGFPNHWHDEEFSRSHGSKKAPRPIEEAALNTAELQFNVRENLLRLSHEEVDAE